MQVTSISTNPTRELWIQRRQALSEMIGSIQSGNIAAAQKDLAQVRQADNGLGLSPAPAVSGSYGVRNRIDFSALFSAVQSGDLNAAQDAWTRLETNRPADVGQAASHPVAAMAQHISSLLNDIAAGNVVGMRVIGSAIASHVQALPEPQASSKALTGDLKALAVAAQAGDLSAAQAAQQQLIQDVQLMQGGAAGASQSSLQHGTIIAASLFDK